MTVDIKDFDRFTQTGDGIDIITPANPIEADKYYIKKTNIKTGVVYYKKNKTVDGWITDKKECWQFSKQGAQRIIERLSNPYLHAPTIYYYELEKVED